MRKLLDSMRQAEELLAQAKKLLDEEGKESVEEKDLLDAFSSVRQKDRDLYEAFVAQATPVLKTLIEAGEAMGFTSNRNHLEFKGAADERDGRAHFEREGKELVIAWSSYATRFPPERFIRVFKWKDVEALCNALYNKMTEVVRSAEGASKALPERAKVLRVLRRKIRALFPERAKRSKASPA